MRKFILVFACLLIFGCVPTKEEVLELGNDIDTLMATVDRVQEKIIVVNDEMKDKAELGTVEQLRAGIEASRPFNPYADLMSAVLGLVVVGGSILGKKKLDSDKREIARIASKAHADKVGREKTLLELAALPDASVTAAMVSNLMFTNVGEARARNNTS